MSKGSCQRLGPRISNAILTLLDIFKPVKIERSIKINQRTQQRLESVKLGIRDYTFASSSTQRANAEFAGRKITQVDRTESQP